MQMKTIEDCLEFLDTRFGDTYDIRFVPSVRIGGGHDYRVTISNIPNIPEFSHKAATFTLAIIDVIHQIRSIYDETYLDEEIPTSDWIKTKIDDQFREAGILTGLRPKVKHVDGFGIWIVGHDAYPVALFRYEDEAVEWARENYFCQWLLKGVPFPLCPFATDEQIAEAEEMVKLFKPLPEAED